MRIIAIILALCLGAPPAFAALGGGRNPAPEVYLGCIVPPGGPWTSTPANLSTNHVWFLDPVNGSNSNDGAALTTGGGHGPWQTTAALSGVHGGDIVYLAASGSYGDVTLSTSNSKHVTLAALPWGPAPLFNTLTISGSEWVIKGIKTQPSNPSVKPDPLTVNPPAHDVVIIGSEITTYGAGYLNQNIAGWFGSTSGVTLTVSSLAIASSPIVPGMEISGTSATIEPYGTGGTSGTGGVGTYQLSASIGTFAPGTIMGALNTTAIPTAVLGNDGLNVNTGTNCISILANHIHSGYFAVAALSASNMLFAYNEIDHAMKSFIAGGGVSNIEVNYNYFHDSLSLIGFHPDLIANFCNALNCTVSNLEYIGNIYIEKTDSTAMVENGSFGFFIQGGLHSEAFCNLIIANNVLVTSALHPIETHHVCGGVIANNTVMSPDNPTSAPNGSSVGIDLDDVNYQMIGATWSGSVADFSLTPPASGQHPTSSDVAVAGVVTTTGFTPGGYNGQWTVSNAYGPATFASVTSGGTGGTGSSGGTVYTGVAQTSSSGAGTGATWNITVNASGVATAAAINAQGTKYALGDTIQIASGSGVPSGVVLTITASALSDIFVTMPSNPGGSASISGLLGYPSHNLLIRNNLVNLLGIIAPQSADVILDHNTVAPSTGTLSNNVIAYSFLGGSATCSSSCTPPNGGLNTILSRGALTSSSVWTQWDTTNFKYDLRPLSSASAIVGQGAPWGTPSAANIFYPAGQDQRRRPWPNPPDLGAILH